MAALARLQTADCSNQVLDLFTSVNGVLTNVFELQYNIWDKTTGTPVQVFPATPGDRVTVDVAHDCPTGGRIATGRYVAAWTVPGDANVGTYQIRWYMKLISSVPEQVFIEEFEVLPEVFASGVAPEEVYCLISDMREEGVPTSVPDAFLMKRILLASRFVDRTTRRFFYPKAMTFRVDGTGGPKLLLFDPIIGIDYIKFEISPIYPDEFTDVESDLMRIYNRHLSYNFTEPDDRNSPKIELFNPGYVRQRNTQLLTSLNFPMGQQNIEIAGVFGYTDPSGPNPYALPPNAAGVVLRNQNLTNQGRTPDLITHVTKLLVIKELDKMAKTAARFDKRNRYRLTSERTRDQAYTLEPLGPRTGAFFTGDPEIDNILAYFMRPPMMGAV